jgi:hypothetical protein
VSARPFALVLLSLVLCHWSVTPNGEVKSTLFVAAKLDVSPPKDRAIPRYSGIRNAEQKNMILLFGVIFLD